MSNLCNQLLRKGGELMKIYSLIVLAAVLALYTTGCGKKQTAMEEPQELISMETVGSLNAAALSAPETKTAEPKATAMQNVPAAGEKLQPLPPAGPYKPTAVQIQTALKNAYFYAGEIDGVVGPKTKKAIEEFQSANRLQADGKVGPKTWAVLSKYLNAPSPEATTAPTTKKKR